MGIITYFMTETIKNSIILWLIIICRLDLNLDFRQTNLSDYGIGF